MQTFHDIPVIFMKKITLKILPFILILFAASLACQAPLKAGTRTPEITATLTPEVIQTTEAATPELTATATGLSGQIGSTTITITEAQLNTYMQEQLATQPDVPFKNPKVFLKENEILVTGDVTMGPITSQANIILQPYVDQDKLKIKILSAKLGAFPFPDSVLKNLDQMINQNLDQLVSQNNVNLQVQNVTVTNGLMTVIGALK
jgi:uncharacterized protein YpmS